MTILGVIFTILAYGVGVLLALTVLIVMLPFSASAAVTLADDEFAARAALVWTWGLVGVSLHTGERAQLSLFGLRLFSLSRGRGDEAEPARGRSGKGRRRLCGALERRRDLWRILTRLAATLHLEGAIDGVVGLDNPADTALLVAALGELQRAAPGLRVRLDYDWLETRADVVGTLRARLWLIEVLAVATVLLLERGTRETLRAVF